MSTQTATLLFTHSDKLRGHGEDGTSRKRTRDESSISTLDQRPFTIQVRIGGPHAGRTATDDWQPDPTNIFAKPRTFTPIVLINRSQLPLTYIDTVGGESRIFSASIHAFNLPEVTEHGQPVLVVFEKAEQRLFAVEQVAPKSYALCKLHEWVDVGKIDERAKLQVEPYNVKRVCRTIEADQNGGAQPWWASAAVPHMELPRTYSPLSKTPQPPARSNEATKAPALTQGHHRDLTTANEGASMTNDVAAQPEAGQQALEDLAKHYLEALYLSRTPLAYFSKGPLTRTRMLYTATEQSKDCLAELVDFLKGSVLSSSVMDKKYRESVTEMIKALPSELTPGKTPRSQKKRKWKPKRDKTGFFVGEKDSVEQWWRMHDDPQANVVTESTDAALKRRLPLLRNRETFLQIMLILEVMALESQMAQDKKERPDAETQDQQASKPSETEGRHKKKKEVDIASVLETLLDRLCIWCSVDISSPTKTDKPNGEQAHDPSDDLKSFCIEVIIPFYMSRVPEKASLVSRRLGGPSAPTPDKRKGPSTSRKPGEPAVRQAPEKRARKPLARVSTDTFDTVQHRLPVLKRSSTDVSALVKDENQDALVPLENIPAARSRREQRLQAQIGRRTSVMSQTSFNRREVDLSAMSQANEVKARKKAEVERKLRDAISTLKKPNRSLAVEEIAKSTDESFAKAIAKSRSTAHTGSSRRAGDKVPQIAVSATPRHVKATPARHKRYQPETTDTGNELLSSAVPSSSARLRASFLGLPQGTPAVPQTGHRPRHALDVSDTPSRGFARFMPSGLVRQPGTLLESPTTSRSLPLMETPAKPLRMPSLLETPITKYPVTRPSKQPQDDGGNDRASSNLFGLSSKSSFEDSGIGLESQSKPPAKSIYDDLGWNDDYGDLV